MAAGVRVAGAVQSQALQAPRGKRGQPPKWQQQIEAISKLPKARQRFVSEILDTVLAQH